MAHTTSHLYGYDCGTCAQPVHYVGLEWFHNSRRVDCVITSVVEVSLKATVATVDNVELVA